MLYVIIILFLVLINSHVLLHELNVLLRDRAARIKVCIRTDKQESPFFYDEEMFGFKSFPATITSA